MSSYCHVVFVGILTINVAYRLTHIHLSYPSSITNGYFYKIRFWAGGFRLRDFLGQFILFIVCFSEWNG